VFVCIHGLISWFVDSDPRGLMCDSSCVGVCVGVCVCEREKERERERKRERVRICVCAHRVSHLQ